jgi:hypothetical protein
MMARIWGAADLRETAVQAFAPRKAPGIILVGAAINLR